MYAARSPAARPAGEHVTSTRIQRWCAWSGIAFLVIFFTGAMMAQVLPPPSPTQTPAEVAAQWSSHADLKRAGLCLMMISAGFLFPFTAAISAQLRRIEGHTGPLTMLQLIAGGVGVFAILMPTMLFMGIAFRPERAPEVTSGLMDAAFVPFVINFPPVFAQCVAFGLAVLLQRGAVRPFPRWSAWFSFWVAFLFLPGVLLLFFRTSAWAWDGLLSFWLVAAIFGGWILLVSILLLRTLRQGDDAAAGAPAEAVA
ncbi:hypothetical protein [Patulibacter brassicae]|uniref:hypothetical protein n=1 Tax=Patulibacter brassicae TaxID=1705717 RepID=UPI0029F5460D|nr:hypothetical protein [Patulibacter brassicae]